MAAPADETRRDDDRAGPPARADLSARADQFFAALTRGGADDWEPFLASLTGTARVAVLAELVLIDLGHRWARGGQAVVEEYVARFPELGPLDRVPAALILEEHRCRVKAGITTDLDSYRSRFPAQFPALRDILSGGGGPHARTVARPAGEAPSVVTKPTEGVIAAAQQYDLLRELGRGQFGEVWLARKQPSGIEKAVKILLQPADAAVARRELKSLELIKNFRHPFLLATEDFWVVANRLYVVLELADGTLRGRFKECRDAGKPGIPAAELVGYVREAAEGLDYLHARKVIHRDVKPDNILLLNGHAKVADFGLAREQEQLVASVSFAGTPAYMAPEVWGGEGGAPSDQYGLAVMYVELRQGRPPFHFGRGADVMLAHVEGKFDFEPLIPEAERVVLRRGMHRLPEERYPSCSAFANDLAVALALPGAKASPPPVRPPPRPAEPVASPSAYGTLRTDPQTEPESKPVRAARRPPRTHLGNTWAAHPTSLRGSGSRRLVAFVAIAGGLAAGGIWLAGGTTPAIVAPDDPLPTVSKGTDDPKVVTNGVPDPGGKKATDPPVPPPRMLPRGTDAEPGARMVTLAGGRVVPEWLVATRGGEAVRFRLIAPVGGAGGSVAPFYVAEAKVSNRFFQHAAKAANLVETLRAKPGGADAPAVCLTANEAATFAEAAFEGGRLPTPDEWDHAAGFYDRLTQAGPLRPGGRARVGLADPAPIRGGDADAARNQYDLIDMAGNGREWTAAVLPARGKPFKLVTGPAFAPLDLVVLRGRNYTHRTPLSYDMMEYERAEPQTQLAGVPSPYTGFRVVLPLP